MNEPTTETYQTQLPVDDAKTAARKRAKFEEIAIARTKRAIKAIRVLAGMGGKNRYSYEFNADDVDRIAAALDKEVAALRQMMIAPNRLQDIEFDL